MTERDSHDVPGREAQMLVRSANQRCRGGFLTAALLVVLLPISAGKLLAGDPSVIFPNGFESGGTQGWSATVPSTCTDGVKTDDETDIDCGGASCAACLAGQDCGTGADCVTTICDLGVCVDCAIAADCPGEDSECATRFCSAGSCGVSVASHGTQLAVQAPGDCQVWICDGAGGETLENDDSDIPDDGTICTDDACIGGTPASFPANEGEACEEPGDSGICQSGVCVPNPT